MWLGKLFGGRKRQANMDSDEEPARFPTQAASESTGAPSDLRRRTQDQLKAKATGFDPYNSGTFKKKDNAWERVVRR